MPTGISLETELVWTTVLRMSPFFYRADPDIIIGKSRTYLVLAIV